MKASHLLTTMDAKMPPFVKLTFSLNPILCTNEIDVFYTVSSGSACGFWPEDILSSLSHSL